LGYFVLVGLLLFVVVIAALILVSMSSEGTEDRYGNKKGNFPGNLYAVGVGVVGFVLFLVITAFATTDTVQNGHIGIVKQFGSLVDTTGEGLVTHYPWQSVSPVSVQDELKTYDMNQAGSAGSKDNQPVFLVVQVSYRVDASKAVDLYRATGGHFVERYLDPATYEHTKAIFAKYAATNVLANRERIRRRIEKAINKEMAPKGILIKGITLKNIHFTPALSKEIERTVRAKQRAKREEAQVAVVRHQAEQRVANATGKAKAIKIKADADAYSYRVKQRSLSPLLIQQQAIDKLNPNVQVIVCPTGTTCVPQAVLATVSK
jgi:regulator of protease activity HflC (stomatin/prohibitin superfamily)